jgi:hypothetical protein
VPAHNTTTGGGGEEEKAAGAGGEEEKVAGARGDEGGHHSPSHGARRLRQKGHTAEEGGPTAETEVEVAGHGSGRATSMAPCAAEEGGRGGAGARGRHAGGRRR